MANRAADRWSPGIALGKGVSSPMEAIGGLFAMSADAIRFAFQRPFQRREFLEQAWFVARVSLAPTLLVAIPFTVLVSFTLNILLRELGAADLSGAGANCQDSLVMTAPGGWLELEEPPVFTKVSIISIHFRAHDHVENIR